MSRRLGRHRTCPVGANLGLPSALAAICKNHPRAGHRARRHTQRKTVIRDRQRRAIDLHRIALTSRCQPEPREFQPLLNRRFAQIVGMHDQPAAIGGALKLQLARALRLGAHEGPARARRRARHAHDQRRQARVHREARRRGRVVAGA